MKELTIVLFILIIIIGGALYVDKYLENTSNELAEMLKNLKSDINSDKSIEDIKKESKEVYNKWKEVEEGWALTVVHEELDLIETSLIKIKAQIEEETLSKSIEEIDTSIFLVKHISEKEKFCLKNIF